MREGAIPRTLKDSKAIFVTTNASLALASRRFEMNHNGTKNSIPSCITDSFLGTLIWLNTPDKAEDITKKKLIADCYAGNFNSTISARGIFASFTEKKKP